MSGPEGSSIKNHRLCVMAFVLEENVMNDEKYMEMAYQEALKALAEDEVPIGAVLVHDGKIIAKSYNQRQHHNQVTAHAEILCISLACEKLQSWHLDECTLYSTLEPCIMCSGAIIQSHIKRVVYAVSADRWLSLSKLLSMHHQEVNHVPVIEKGVLYEKCSLLLKNYFKNKRERY